jgi:two-component system, OmpR family, sensor histidine kinase CpxA
MSIRFPLYARILLWFFLNLVLLTVAFFVLVRGQFRFGLDWMLAAADPRIQAVTDVMVAELNDRPRTNWNALLKRFDDAYRIQFLVFRADGTQLAGEPVPLPPEVRIRLGEGRGPGRMRPMLTEPGAEIPPAEGQGRGRLLRERPGFGPPPGRSPRPDFLPGPFAPLRGPYPKFLVRTDNPTRYWLIVRPPINDPDRPSARPLALVAVSRSLSAGGLLFDLKPWIAVGLGAVVFSALLWLPLIRGITRSIGQMTHATRQIAEGRFDGRVNERRRDELGALGQSVNRMAARLAGFVTGQKRFLGDIAHELCSPIARIQVALGILEQRADEKQKDYVEDLREEVQHMSSLVNELLSFSKAGFRQKDISLKPVPLAELVRRVVSREAGTSDQVRIEIAEHLHALAEPDLLARALANLIRNSIRYAGGAGPVNVSASSQDVGVTLTVADSGPGVPEGTLQQIFDPFFRVESSRSRDTGGIGLGLAIVKTCVEACQGTVVARNRQPSGLEVTIKLPAAVDAGSAN